MKKSLFYILILIALIGLLAPIIKTGAQGGEYNLLAPLPCTGGPETGCVNGKLTTFDPSQQSKLGDYLNKMIPLLIGICAVLAVIMIVKGGIQYMTTESISGKGAGKESIKNALLGLLLALGAWLILNTINPNILKTDLSSLKQQTVEVIMNEGPEGEANAVLVDAGAPPGPTGSCKEGIQRIAGISVCGSIAQGFRNMFADASQAGCILMGGGYRSPEAQANLRRKNCNGDTTNPNANCVPPTALPGRSRHQQGLAIDFKSPSGGALKGTDFCFWWLQNNASRHGFYNLSSEPWHWSIDGK